MFWCKMQDPFAPYIEMRYNENNVQHTLKVEKYHDWKQYKNGKVEQKPLFVYDREEKRLKKTGELKAREKLADAGD